MKGGQTLTDPRRLIARRGRHLPHAELAGFRVEHDDVGEGAADVDAHVKVPARPGPARGLGDVNLVRAREHASVD